MINNHRERIKIRIKEAILMFKRKEISYTELISYISSNIDALDNLDKSIENALINLCTEMETIYYMRAPEYHFNCMLKEIEAFESVIDKLV